MTEPSSIWLATVSPRTPFPHPRSRTSSPGSASGRWSSITRVPMSRRPREKTLAYSSTEFPPGSRYEPGNGLGPGSRAGSSSAKISRAFFFASEVGDGPMTDSKSSSVERWIDFTMAPPTITAPSASRGRNRRSWSSSRARLRGILMTTTSIGPWGSSVLGTRATAPGSRPLRARFAVVAWCEVTESPHDWGLRACSATASAPNRSFTISQRSPATPESVRWASRYSSAASQARSGIPRRSGMRRTWAVPSGVVISTSSAIDADGTASPSNRMIRRDVPGCRLPEESKEIRHASCRAAQP